MQPLDPIVSLSVAIAEGPGSFAFFLGSGVSRDAGVPTGAEVYWNAVGELHRVELATDDTPDREALAEWLESTGRAELGYSGVLELLTPDPATRRAYLAKNFDGIEPGRTHLLLAELAAQGLIKVFVTTNFDRLLEHALQSQGIEPVVVTCDADLHAAPSREHSPCYVVKPHGDYLQQTIRNTPAELAELEPALTAELQEVVDRYGVVVIGYSGSDEGISAIFRARRSRYGLYWVSRGEITEPGRSLLEAGAGRQIIRPAADDFLTDLQLRLRVFETQPSGLTPVTINDQVLDLLGRSDQVKLSELLRRERMEFEQRVEEVIATHREQRPDIALAGVIYDELLPVLERRLASLLPLVNHDGTRFDDEVAALADFQARQPTVGHSFFPGVVEWCTWWLANFVGAFAIRMRRMTVLTALFDAEVATRYGTRIEPLLSSWSGGAGDPIGRAVTARHSDGKWFDYAFQAVLEEGATIQLLAERYPELVRTEDEFKRVLVEWDFVSTAAIALRGRQAFARWSMYGDLARGFVMRLKADPKLRHAVAAVAHLTLEEFDAQAADALATVQTMGQWPDTDVIALLRPPAPPE